MVAKRLSLNNCMGRINEPGNKLCKEMHNISPKMNNISEIILTNKSSVRLTHSVKENTYNITVCPSCRFRDRIQNVRIPLQQLQQSFLKMLLAFVFRTSHNIIKSRHFRCSDLVGSLNGMENNTSSSIEKQT